MKQLKESFLALLLLTVITGVIYPVITTLIGQFCFNYKANGSLIKVKGEIVGSELIGQNFSSDKYLWGRPSSTSDFAYNPLASSGSNLGPLNPALLSGIHDRVAILESINKGIAIPVDLVTASASGLDPEISLASAYYQIPRIAKARNISNDAVKVIVDQIANEPLFGIWGEHTVNVLLVNLALDQKEIEEK